MLKDDHQGIQTLFVRKMAHQRLRFSLTAYDPTPSDVSLAFDEKNCTVESTSGANVSMEEYKYVLSVLVRF